MKRSFAQFSHAVRIRVGERAVTARASQPEAISWTVQGMTKEGNPSMANAIRKRIALAAVVALGAGVISAVPAAANQSTAVSGAITLTTPKIVRVNDTSDAFAFSIANTRTYNPAAAVGADRTHIAALTLTKPSGASNPAVTITQPSGGTTGSFTVNAATAGAYSILLFNDVDPDTTAGGTSSNDPNGIPNVGEAQLVVNFTTAGVPATVVLDKATVSSAAGVANTITATVTDAAGAPTYPVAANGEFFALSSTVSAGSATLNPTAGLIESNFDQGTGKATFTVANNTASTTTTVTVAGSGVLTGITSRTVTLSTVAATTGAGKATVATSNTLIVDSVDTTAALNAYFADPAQTTFVFNVSGLTPNTAVTYDITRTGTFTITRNAAAYTSGDDVTEVADASGNLTVTVRVSTGSISQGDTIVLDLNTAATAAATGQTDARVEFAESAYAVSVTSPAVTPSLAVTGAAITVAGSVKDQYGNPAVGATVTATGTVTPSGTALTGTATTSSTGAFSIVLPAAAATTTSVSIAVTAVKTGIPSITGTGASPSIVNFTATGVPTSITLTPTVGNQTTTLPIVNVPTDGTVLSGTATVTTASYTIADATVSGSLDAGLDEVVQFSVTSAPAGQIVISGSAGVLFSTSNSADWGAYTSTVTVAGSGGNVFAITSRASAEHTVTATSGSTTASFKFRSAASAATGARNVAVTGPATLKAGEVATYTIKVTDNFGNPVDLTTAAGTVTASVSGPAFINGSLTTLTGIDTNASGEATVSLVAARAGTGSIVLTVTGVNGSGPAQFAAVAGSLTTSSGSNGFTASTASATTSVTLTASEDATAIDTLRKQVTDLAASVATLIAGLAAQVRRLQTALTNLRKLVRAL